MSQGTSIANNCTVSISLWIVSVVWILRTKEAIRMKGSRNSLRHENKMNFQLRVVSLILHKISQLQLFITLTWECTLFASNLYTCRYTLKKNRNWKFLQWTITFIIWNDILHNFHSYVSIYFGYSNKTTDRLISLACTINTCSNACQTTSITKSISANKFTESSDFLRERIIEKVRNSLV